MSEFESHWVPNSFGLVFQCGFQSKKGTIDHLICFKTNIREAFIKNEHLIAIFFNLEKASMMWKYGVMKDLHDVDIKDKIATIYWWFPIKKKIQSLHWFCSFRCEKSGRLFPTGQYIVRNPLQHKNKQSNQGISISRNWWVSVRGWPHVSNQNISTQLRKKNANRY